MLTTLRLRDFAIIDELSVEFGPGMNVLSGETGAGKSILVDAVHLLLGGRARTEVIRTGADEAVVEALFEPGAGTLAALAAFEIDAGEGLLIRRVISRSGKNRIAVNGSPVTLAILERVAESLVDVTGQHEHHSLLRPETHLDLVDAYGDLGQNRGKVAESYAKVRALHEERSLLEKDERERVSREDFLQFQLKELQGADLRAGEEAELTLEKARLRSAEKLHAASTGGEEALYDGEPAAAALIGRIERELSELRHIDPELGRYAERLASARVEVEDVARSLGRYARGISADPSRLGELEDRLATIARLRRKHGGTLEDVLAVGLRLSAELARLCGASERLASLADELVRAEAELQKRGEALTKERRKAAKKLEAAVEDELGTLALSGARLRIAVAPRTGGEDAVVIGGAAAGAKGFDKVELLFAPNAGEEARPLHRIASGGELSRITLALKNVLAKNDPVDTYVFDEVDAGIGGGVGEILGRKLKEVSRHRQVLCVTHLAQIAAFADRHFRVQKQVLDGRTVSAVSPLDEHTREEEVARMLGGLTITDRTRAHAEEMIRAAQ